MPEGDVVFRTAARLHQVLAGHTLTEAELRWPQCAHHQLAGHTVVNVTPRGKHILMRLRPKDANTDPITVHSHLRMEGSWRIFHPTDPDLKTARSPRSATRAMLATTQYVAVGHKLGLLTVLPTNQENSIVGHLGPDLLGPDWDLDAGVHAVQALPDEPIGAVLLDQRVVAGIGTFFMAEALFVHGTSPWQPVKDVPHLPRLMSTAQRMLHENCSRAVQSTTGSVLPGQASYVHGRRRKPCRRCRNPIRMQWLDPVAQQNSPQARTAYFCGTCQTGPIPSPTAHPKHAESRPPRRR